jgi:hypothetical protein
MEIRKPILAITYGFMAAFYKVRPDAMTDKALDLQCYGAG